jgi:predicted permease
MNLSAFLRVIASAVFRRSRVESEMDEELHEHIQNRAEDLERSGMPYNEAERQARLEFGGLQKFKEECRETLGTHLVDTLLQDVRYALRTLRKSPGFTIVAVITLALGIGANTAIFSVVEGVVFAPLPYHEPDQLVMVMESNPRFAHVWTSYPDFRDWQRTARSFEQMAAFRSQAYDLSNPGTPEHLDGNAVSAGFFSTLGIKLALGHDFSRQEDERGGARAAIISDRLWRNRFAQNSRALGESVTLDGVDYTVVGVLPPKFRFWTIADVFTPLGQGDPIILDARGSHDGIGSIARLKPNVTITQARAEMSAIQKGLDQIYPDSNRDLGTDVMPLKQEMIGDIRGTLLMLLGAVALVLLITCANVANLLLARSATRGREFALRSALGASRSRLIRQLITEGVVLSLLGGMLGLVVSISGIKPLLAIMPGSLPHTENIGVNTPVLFFTFAVSITVGIFFGLAPALKRSTSDLHTTLKEGGRGTTGLHHRVQNGLVILQMGLTVVLLVSTGLLFRTIRQLWEVNPGFNPERIITFKVGVSRSLTSTASSTRIAYQQLIERIRDVPGVQAADFTNTVPLSGQGGTIPFWIGAQKPVSLQGAPRLVGFLTGPEYFRTMGIPLLRGRLFTQEDTITSPCVIVIDSVFARKYFPDSEPLGKTITFGFFSPTGPCRIIGVVGHVRHWELSDPSTRIQNQMYFPLYQDPDEWVAVGYPDLTVMVRTPLDVATVIPAIRGVVYNAGSDQPVYDVQTMRQIVSDSISTQRFPMTLLGTFASLALLLASVGIYGVISYSVAQRSQEIGIRMALGAQRRDVFHMIVGQGLRLALAGLTVGGAAALVLTSALPSFSNLLYGVKTPDPWTFVAVFVALIGTSILACYVPARRAMLTDPVNALRLE